MASANLRQRVEREREAHADRDVLGASYVHKNRFWHIMYYPSHRRLLEMRDGYLQHLVGKTVLDYGCGRGEQSLRYLARGAYVSGIDISAPYIADAECSATLAAFPRERYCFRVMDAHSLDFPDASFDLVVGDGILHHLAADVAICEIHRVLKLGGRVLLREPLADSPLLKLFRRLTPKSRTADEKPFSAADLRRLTMSARWQVETSYCGLLEAPVAMFTSLLLRPFPDNYLLRVADWFERWTHRRGLLLSWNQYVLLNMVKI